jgi:predicted nucleotide-binding protein
VLIVAEDGIPNRGIAYRGGGKFIVSVPAGAKPDWLLGKQFKPYFDDWAQSVRARPDVFLGYCSRAQDTAHAILIYLQKVLKVSVMDWAMDFDPGPSILQSIAEAAEQCHCGIFLFTKDDAPPKGKITGAKALPRDNVVFEAGYFMHAKGPERVLIVLENGAKMPADLGGNIFAALANRKSIDSVQETLRKFCDSALDRT